MSSDDSFGLGGADETPEILDHRAVPPRGGGGARRVGAVAGAAVAVVAMAGAGWGAYSFLSGGGTQPAAAMPASTLAYTSLDLDPSASQKIEAIKTIRKFPALKKQLGLQADDDLRRAVFEQIQQEGQCENLDYDTDIAPWVGDRIGFGAAEVDDQLAPVVALQVSDQGKAEKGITALAACGDAGADDFGYAFSGDYAVISDGSDHAETLAADASEASLADDAQYQHWTAEAGDSGVLSFYLSSRAPTTLTRLSGMADEVAPDLGGARADAMREQVTEMGADFQGAAGSVRFADGALEAEMAAGGVPDDFAGDDTGTLVGDLPKSTGLALAVNLREGWLGDWFASLTEMMGQVTGQSVTPRDLFAEIEAETGLRLPDDAETLIGHHSALAVDGNIDLRSIGQATQVPDVPVAMLVDGDPEGVQSVLEKVNSLIGPGKALSSKVDGGRVAYGLDPAWEGALLEDGGLGDTESFQRAVPNAEDARSVLYVNFDAGEGWLTSLDDLVGGDAQKFRANAEPLDAFGLSTWTDGEVSHGLLTLTTD